MNRAIMQRICARIKHELDICSNSSSSEPFFIHQPSESTTKNVCIVEHSLVLIVPVNSMNECLRCAKSTSARNSSSKFPLKTARTSLSPHKLINLWYSWGYFQHVKEIITFSRVFFIFTSFTFFFIFYFCEQKLWLSE